MHVPDQLENEMVALDCAELVVEVTHDLAGVHAGVNGLLELRSQFDSALAAAAATAVDLHGALQDLEVKTRGRGLSDDKPLLVDHRLHPHSIVGFKYRFD